MTGGYGKDGLEPTTESVDLDTGRKTISSAEVDEQKTLAQIEREMTPHIRRSMVAFGDDSMFPHENMSKNH